MDNQTRQALGHAQQWTRKPATYGRPYCRHYESVRESFIWCDYRPHAAPSTRSAQCHGQQWRSTRIWSCFARQNLFWDAGATLPLCHHPHHLQYKQQITNPCAITLPTSPSLTLYDLTNKIAITTTTSYHHCHHLTIPLPCLSAQPTATSLSPTQVIWSLGDRCNAPTAVTYPLGGKGQCMRHTE